MSSQQNVYLDLPIDSDPQDIMNDFVLFMQSVFPGWDPNSGNLDVWLAQAMSIAAAESRTVASAVPRTIFRWFGATLIGLPPTDDVAATTSFTFTVQDNLGYIIPSGTQVSIAKTGDEVYGFATLADAIVPAGSISVAGVTAAAVIAGSAASGLGGVATPASLIDPLAFVTAVTQDRATSGGTDAETDDEYLARLAGYLQLLAPRPILAVDFAAFARNIAGVYRATAIDGYNPATGSFTDERTVAVAGVDSGGNAISSTIKAAVQADLQARREVNFIVNVIDPTITLIDIVYDVQSLPGYDKIALQSSINAALQTYLSPATWGSSSLDQRNWDNKTVIRYLELAQVINGVPGVDYITGTGTNYNLTFGPHGGAQTRTDYILSGAAPLPDANIITGNVH